MNYVDIRTIINILRNRDPIFLRETANHDKDLIKVIKLYCLINQQDYDYEHDFYKSVNRYNRIVEMENKVRRLVKKAPKPYMSDWTGSDFLG